MSLKKDDTIKCPRCAHILKDRNSCPYCGYQGYIPMSANQTRRIKMILYPIAIVIFIVLIIIFSTKA